MQKMNAFGHFCSVGCREAVGKETGKKETVRENECKFSPTEDVTRHSASDAYCQFCYTHKHTPTLAPSVPPALSSLNTFFHLSTHLSLLFMLCSPSPVPSCPPPLLAHMIFLPQSQKFLFLSLSFLFIQPHSLLHSSLPTSLPPSCFSSPATTDDACCDVDWMRESQREETAGMD